MIRQILFGAILALTPVMSATAAEPVTRFDVAEDHTRFVFAPAPVHESGMPAHGNPFVTQGYIYPVGTLKEGTDGVLADGSPAFPDLVLGTWTCDGWFVGEGGDATTGVWLVSRQIMQFTSGDVIITQGTELADIGIANTRPITAATGDYAGLQLAMEQTLLGFHSHMGVQARFVIPEDAYDAQRMFFED
ncbi:hypothetical protein [Roseobacter sinensis]|uniref:Uncharacterized protein n=1 Tax=Roseobacter sinensis TaxID=2931391 RepID=A0ABT3BEP1_9RHOB|nr:hypothetical protein [Roseobacter sp. WL0113]MCV3272044.1 hypothetical protein [Roseobacter sp. WL0113]